MSNFLDTLRTVFTFLLGVLGDIASFFTTNTLGILLLGVVFLGSLISLIVYLFSKMR